MESRCLSRRESDREPMKPVLPDEIIEDILSRLPTKSLLRFSSVSNQCLCLISDPIFIQSQLKHVLSDQNYNRHEKIMITSCLSSKFYSVDYELLSCNQVQLQNLPFSAPYGVSIFGSCNGLLCIGIHKGTDLCYDDIFIWNPLFKNCKRISSLGWQHLDSMLLGFGYDSFTDDYKLVKIHNVRHCGEVYTTKTNSWRTLPIDTDLSHCFCLDFGTFFNGSIYWVAGPVPMLIEFDLKNEKFRLVELPIHRSTHSKLFVVKGCLGVFGSSDNYKYFNLLMMKEDSGNVISWSEINIPRPKLGMGEAIYLKTNYEIVMMGINNHRLISFDEEEFVSEKNDPATSESGKVLIHTDLGYSRDDDWIIYIYNPLDGAVKKDPVGVAVIFSESTIYIETLVSLP